MLIYPNKLNNKDINRGKKYPYSVKMFSSKKLPIKKITYIGNAIVGIYLIRVPKAIKNIGKIQKERVPTTIPSIAKNIPAETPFLLIHSIKTKIQPVIIEIISHKT
jgi:hypothetical protein